MPVKRTVAAEIVTAAEDLVCRLAEERLHAYWSEARGTWDLDSGLRSRDHRQQDYLTLLRTIRDAKAALDELADRYAYRAKRNGADFAEIGAATGVSRQAARQRHLRQTVLRPITMIGGPWAGRPMNILLGDSVVRLPAFDPWLDEHPWLKEELNSFDDPVYAIYRRTPDDPDVYRFRQYENPDGTVTHAPEHHLRIYRIADSWRLSSWVVLDYARRVDTQIRGESSRLDRATADKVRALIEDTHRQRNVAGEKLP